MNNDKLFVGEVRPSQLMYTYGIGSIVDLPSLSVIVMGLDDWPQNTPLLSEPRLLNAVQFHLHTVEELRVLPRLETDPSSPFESAALYGVPVAVFPRWWVCPVCRRLAPLNSGLFELDKKPFQPDRTVYRHTGCTEAKGKRSPEAIPSRILVACEEGHLDDFPWVDFVHRGNPCKHEKSLLKLIEYGPSGEARDLEVRCDCGVSRRLAEAFGKDNRNKMPLCTGRWPHLRKYDVENCKNHARAIVLGATNLWFPATLGVLSIPSNTDHLHQLVEASWNILRVAKSPEILAALRLIGQIQGELADYSDTEIIEAIEQYDTHQTQTQQIPDIKLPEWEVFSNYNPNLNSSDFSTRPLKLNKVWAETLKISNVLLVDRLREVQAVLGFARIDAVGELTDPDQQVLVRTAPLAHTPPKWVPSTELKGEGIFFHFAEDAIQAWERKEIVRDHASQFLASHASWREKRGIQNPYEGFLGMRYVLLHSFAHTLMRQIALEAGYSSASLKERIYARPAGHVGGPMSGILIYTSASDSEGTLGGLIGLGEDEAVLYQMVRNSLESIALCAGDPLCAEHNLDQSGKTIHAAACHACLFSPETSCERGNKYLDRSVLIPTLRDEVTPLAFFEL
jgi:hypothetical protein